MPVRVIGMIGVEPKQGTTLHVIAGGVSAPYLREFAQRHEAAGFDQVLVGYYSSSAEGFNVASHAAAHTKTLSFLIAHRPGIVSPSLAARAAATFDHLSDGRLSLHIIAGVTDKEQQSEGDFLGKEQRYERAAEYLGLLRRIWTAPQPFDHAGTYYRFNGAFSAVKPLQQPYPKLLFGGSSAGALAMGAEHCDVYAMYGEPLAETAERIADFRQRAATFGRTPGFNVSFRPIIAPTEGEAWDKARRMLRDIEDAGLPKHAQDKSAERMLAIAARGDVQDERLWMPIATASGAKGNTSCLVGTPRQVADAMLKYYRLGVTSFLIRGFDPLADTTEFGRELIPMLKAGALACGLPAAAQYPDRPLRLVVPYPPGATNDILGRAFAEQLSREVGQSVIIENRGGAGTAIGAQAVATARPDGHTMLLGTGSTFVLNPALRPHNLSYDPVRDFAMVAIMAEVPIIFIANPQLPARSLAEMVAHARANPGRLNFSSSGIGTSLHLAGEMFAKAAGIQLVHVPYPGSAQAMLAVVGGDVRMMSEVVSGAVPGIQAGQVVPLAVTSETRLSILPNVPTVAESGYPGFQALGWYGLAVPRATPAPIVARLREATNRILGAGTMKAHFEPSGLIILPPRDAAAVERYLEQDRERWVPLIRALNISAD